MINMIEIELSEKEEGKIDEANPEANQARFQRGETEQGADPGADLEAD